MSKLLIFSIEPRYWLRKPIKSYRLVKATNKVLREFHYGNLRKSVKPWEYKK